MRNIYAIGLASAVALSSPALAIDYFVDPSGADGAYTTIQAAVDAVAGQTATDRANIFIAPGTYNEIVTVGKPYVSFVGQGASPADVTVAFARTPTMDALGQGEVVSIRASATAFMARNVTFENTTPDQNVTQALAVRSRADKTIFDNVRFLGYQDTILIDGNSRQYFTDCFITGDTDFIYGDATAVFDHCLIESTNRGYITAANTKRTTANGLIFLDSTLVPGTDRNELDDGTTAGDNSVFLGRPWHWYDEDTMPSVIFIRTKMDSHIRIDAWDPWNGTGDATVDPDEDRDPHTRYSEFAPMDLESNLWPIDPVTGLPEGRVEWADAMTDDHAQHYTLDKIFGTVDFWNDNPSAQPEGTGQTYLPQGDGLAWDPLAQLALLPDPVFPEPGSWKHKRNNRNSCAEK